MDKPRIEDIEDALDLELRGLLSLCFAKDAAFTLYRYFQEKPAHRWRARDEAGRLMSHAGVRIFAGADWCGRCWGGCIRAWPSVWIDLRGLAF
jgi:hypothetical protein